MSGTDGSGGNDRGGVHRPRVLIGGVGYRWQRDASFGLVVGDELARRQRPPGVEVADLGYGALYVAQDLADAEPRYDRLILLAGMARGREPGRLYQYRWQGDLPDAAEIQARVSEAGAGVVDIDHLLVIAQYFGALPDDVRVIELEPVDVAGGDGLSPRAAALVEEAIEIVWREADLTPRPPSLAGKGESGPASVEQRSVEAAERDTGTPG
jgi:hydrogenase maturation protease